MSLSGISLGSCIPALATIGAENAIASVASATVDKVSDMLSAYAARNLRSGLSVRSHVMKVSGTGGVPNMLVSVTRVANDAPPTVTSSHQRARVFFAKGLLNGDILNSLRNSDGPVRSSSGFVRDSKRLDAVVAKAAKLKRPNFEVSNYQLVVPMGTGPDKMSDERPYRPIIQSQARRVFERIGIPEYAAACAEAIDLGDHTHHDPDTLHVRFMEYVHERNTEVDELTDVAVAEATKLLLQHWRSLGMAVKARPLSDATMDVFGTEVTAGSQGEYRTLGAVSRNDERLVPTLCDSILRYAEAGRQVVRSGREPAFVSSTQQPSGMFGKNERKAAKVVDGVRVAPVPRCIFNVSPVDWALAKFLHGHASEFLSEKDPLHGPGYGPNRGRSWKLTQLLEGGFEGETMMFGKRMIMSDIFKWDAYMGEYLLGKSYDLLEHAVDKTGLDKYNLAARASMVKVSRRHLLEKLVEHPSGYFVHMHGCMPSGSYYTSLLNTVGNNILVISLIIRLLMTEKHLTPKLARARVQPYVCGRLLSYGDNQIVNEELFVAVGLRYDPVKHAEHLARFGMKLKVDETEVSHLLGRARFCSRAAVQTPAGLILVRTHTSLFAKIAGTPDVDPLVFKLWLRATAVDHMGADPVVYNLLKRIDGMVRVNSMPTEVTKSVKGVLIDLAQKFLDDTSPQSLEAALSILNGGFPSRAALLSLHSRASKGESGQRLGTSLLLDFNESRVELTPAAAWCLDQDEASWVAYLKATGQTGVLVD